MPGVVFLVLALVTVTVAFEATQPNLSHCASRLNSVPGQPLCQYRPPGQRVPQAEGPPNTNPRLWELSNANTQFALRLYQHLADATSDNKNIFLSPLSISTAFAMTKLAACGDTLRQLMEVFKFDMITEKTSDQTHYFFSKLNCRLYRKINGSSELVSANQLFGEQSLNFSQTFQNISQAVYNTKLMQVNFKDQLEQARALINDWVAEHTEQRIQDVVPENTLTPNTALVLVNAIYFKGWWKSKFNKKVTTLMDFYRNATSRCRTPMMYQSAKFEFGTFPEDKVKVIELPYGTGKVTMVLVIPVGRTTTLVEVETKLNAKKLDLWLSGLHSQTVDLTLPRFRVQTAFSVKESLQEMGLHDLFNPETANLRGLVDGLSDGLYVSDAFHKAFLEVNEEGSEAAAATSVYMMGRALQPGVETFTANIPFLLFIREVSINTIIFMGRITNPCEST